MIDNESGKYREIDVSAYSSAQGDPESEPIRVRVVETRKWHNGWRSVVRQIVRAILIVVILVAVLVLLQVVR